MTRKKLKLSYIANDYVRKATFKKRKNSLIKKARELSTLCGIDVCAIVYGPYDLEPDVWPSKLGAQTVLSRFKRMPEIDQSKNMMNQESFLQQRIIKSTEMLHKQARDNKEKEMIRIMFQSLVGSLPSLNLMDLNDLGWVIEQYLKDIDKKCKTFNNMAVGGSSSSPGEAIVVEMAAAIAPPPIPHHGVMQNVGGSFQPTAVGGSGEMSMDSMENQQWFMELLNQPNQEQLSFGGDDMILPFGDTNPNPFWSQDFSP